MKMGSIAEVFHQLLRNCVGHATNLSHTARNIKIGSIN